MSITTNDLEFRYSTLLASAGSQLAQADPAKSLGKFISTSVWLGGSLHDLFQLLTGDANALQAVEYRCLFLLNKHATLTWQSPVVWFTSLNAIALDAMGVDPTPASPLASSGAQAVATAAATSIPSGVTFSAPTTKVSGLSLGDLAPGFCRAVWLRRTGPNLPVALSGTVTSATNATPIVITSVGHGLVTGRQVTVTGVLGNTNANGTWVVTRVDNDRFSLDGSVGNAAYSGAGTWLATNQDGLSLRVEGDTA